jgi:hypothetical protein
MNEYIMKTEDPAASFLNYPQFADKLTLLIVENKINS